MPKAMPPQVINIFEIGDYESQVRRAGASLRDGGIVVLPTETVYGAAGSLRQPDAVTRLRALRNGGDDKPLTVHLASASDASRYLGTISELGKRMMSKLWPGPVALVFDVPPERRVQVSAELNVPEAELYSGSQITLRCPDHIVFSDVAGKVDGPVALTLVDSGNWSNLDGKAEIIFDAGPTKYSKPSTIVKVKDDSYDIVREGVYDRRIIERIMRTTVLFVCSGNTCRSPMAESLARQRIADRLGVEPDELEKKKGIVVLSAGSFALPGARATPQAVEAVRQHGADLSKHRSRPLTVELIHQADHVFTMSRSHAAAVMALVPSAAGKTQTLDPSGDIDDPIGGDTGLYQSLATQLTQLIDREVLTKVAT